MATRESNTGTTLFVIILASTALGACTDARVPAAPITPVSSMANACETELEECEEPPQEPANAEEASAHTHGSNVTTMATGVIVSRTWYTGAVKPPQLASTGVWELKAWKDVAPNGAVTTLPQSLRVGGWSVDDCYESFVWQQTCNKPFSGLVCKEEGDAAIIYGGITHKSHWVFFAGTSESTIAAFCLGPDDPPPPPPPQQSECETEQEHQDPNNPCHSSDPPATGGTSRTEGPSWVDDPVSGYGGASDEAVITRSNERPDVNVIEIRESALTADLLSHALMSCDQSIRKHGAAPARSVGVTLAAGLRHPPMSATRQAVVSDLVSRLRDAPLRTIPGVGRRRAITVQLDEIP